MWKDKKYRRILLACIRQPCGSRGLLYPEPTHQNLVYKERLNQDEITLIRCSAIWRMLLATVGADVNVQCKRPTGTGPADRHRPVCVSAAGIRPFQSEEKQITLLAVDSAGRYYTAVAEASRREMYYLEDDPEWVNYVTNSLTESDSRMVFLKRLDTPITLQAGTAQISLRYYGIAQSMEQLNTYFRCDAYDDHNSVYVLENNGLKLFNSNNTELLKGQNVYTVLSQMSYLHGSSFQQAKAELQENGVR